jgi:hypothetical protein
LNVNKINWFLLFKLPSAWFCGVRVKEFDENYCKVGVRHKWINQNPFKSMYFAVQNMAAELSTGVLVMQSIKELKLPISMLVVETQSQFYKKATGFIYFECHDGELAKHTIQKSLKENCGQEIEMKVKAHNKDNDLVSEFLFKWSVKPKSK